MHTTYTSIYIQIYVGWHLIGVYPPDAPLSSEYPYVMGSNPQAAALCLEHCQKVCRQVNVMGSNPQAAALCLSVCRQVNVTGSNPQAAALCLSVCRQVNVTGSNPQAPSKNIHILIRTGVLTHVAMQTHNIFIHTYIYIYIYIYIYAYIYIYISV